MPGIQDLIAQFEQANVNHQNQQGDLHGSQIQVNIHADHALANDGDGVVGANPFLEQARRERAERASQRMAEELQRQEEERLRAEQEQASLALAQQLAAENQPVAVDTSGDADLAAALAASLEM